MTKTSLRPNTLLIILNTKASKEQLAAGVDSLITAQIFGQPVVGVFLSEVECSESHAKLQRRLQPLLKKLSDASLSPDLYWCSSEDDTLPIFFKDFGVQLSIKRFVNLLNNTQYKILNF